MQVIVSREVQEDEAGELLLTRTVFESLQDYRRSQLLERARLLSELPHFRAATAVYDPSLPPAAQEEAVATVREVARRMLSRVGVDLLILAGPDGRPIIAVGPVIQDGVNDWQPIEAAATRALDGDHAEAVVAVGGGLANLIAVPMQIGSAHLGALCLGQRLDSEVADALERMTGSAVALVGERGVLARSPGVPASATAPLTAAWKEAFAPAGAGIAPTRLRAGDDRFRTLWVPLRDIAPRSTPAAFVVLRSEDRALAFLADVRNALLVLAAGAAAGFVFSYLFARHITVPIRRLVGHTERLGRGELEATVEVSGSDELALLGDAFNRMGAGLAESRRRLEETNRSLEERTRDLEQVNRDLLRSKEETEAVNRALEETHAQLVQAGKLAAFGELGASIAHELRQPLTAVRGFAQLVLHRLPEGSNGLERHLNVIIESVDHMTEIVQGLKDFSRKATFEFRDVDVAEVVRRTVLLLGAQLKARGVRLVLDLEATAPAVRGDPNQIQQVLTNLLGNARDAVAPGNGEIRVETRSIGGGSTLMIAVSDNGCGISEEDLPRIFGSFFTTKPEGEGTGLGLSITQSIIKDHDGRIDVVSAPGRGTTFRVFLPTATARPCWEMIDCVRDCRPEISGKEECSIYRERRGHRCWEHLHQLAQTDPAVSRPDCRACPVFSAKNTFIEIERAPRRAA